MGPLPIVRVDIDFGQVYQQKELMRRTNDSHSGGQYELNVSGRLIRHRRMLIDYFPGNVESFLPTLPALPQCKTFV